ncbi:MFS transporter [Salinimonas chungwhensis]|uniref:MFS transporter n=1 Tax=Salinimonas chungwhensis TaxID=265425 RepID=UPI000376A92A|nr:MFS transporter [Salinimonas chungwhensis]
MAGQKNRLVGALSANKLADLLISAKTTLPALLISLGAPPWMIGWLVPIRESGALLPQAVIGILLRKMRTRHIIWRTGIIVQALSVMGMLIAALSLDNSQAGWAILCLLGLLSMGRAACSLTIKDIEADIANKGERGALLGKASTISGIVTLLVAVPLVFYQDVLGQEAILFLISAAAVAFLFTFIILLPIKTYVDVSRETSENHDAHSPPRFHNFDSIVYRFILVRGLFVHSALVAPYFMLESEADAKSLLPLFLAAEASAALFSSIVWGKVADKSARLALQIAGIIATAACIGLLVLPAPSLWISGLLFFVLAIAHTGVRTGRQTYSLDVTEGQDRTELVAFSNTAIGIILLGFGAFYAMLQSLIGFSVVYVMAGMLCVAIALTFILPAEKAKQ